jgi:hypothetical protein
LAEGILGGGGIIGVIIMINFVVATG